jgi:putative tryptophan/tyrosine transport system substrate-binding protein
MEFTTGTATAVWPLAARAQQAGQTRRIGMLMAFPKGDREGQAWAAAFREELQKTGWTEDRNIQIDYGWAGGDAELIQQIAKRLVEQQPDLIVTQNTPTTQAVIRYTHTIPIIFANVADPIGSRFVASFSRPSGNVTGFVNFASGWSCLGRLRHASLALLSCSTRQLRHLRNISWYHSNFPRSLTP